MEKLDFLGRGWSFPPEFGQDGRSVQLVEAEDDVRQSLRILLATRLGERVMRPDFGCNLDELMFESLTTTFKTYIAELVRNAIFYHEPRVRPDSVEILADSNNDGLILIDIEYTVYSSNSRFNLVFPFYINEASNPQTT